MTNNFYQKQPKNKQKLRKKALERYQTLYEEEKDKKRQYSREQYRNISEEEEKEKKRQYGCGRYKNFLEDEYRKIFSKMQEIKTG